MELDDLSLALVNVLGSKLSSIPKTLKTDLYNHLDEGWTTEEEYEAMGRLEGAKYIVKTEEEGGDAKLSDKGSKILKRTKIPPTSGFNKVIEIVLKNEGGFKNEPDKDKGDPTNMGISWPTWKKYAKLDLGIEPTFKNLKNLTKESASIIYYRRYWLNKKFDLFKNQNLAAMIFDWTVTSGGAVREIQKLLKTEYEKDISIDGMIGAKTIDVINEIEQTDKLYSLVIKKRVSYYKKGAEKGWFSKDYKQGLIDRAKSWEK